MISCGTLFFAFFCIFRSMNFYIQLRILFHGHTLLLKEAAVWK